MKTRDQVEMMLMMCRLAEALNSESAYNDTESAWCAALRWALGRDPKNHGLEQDVEARTKDHMCEE